MKPVVNISAYKFVTLDALPGRRERLRALTTRLDLRGTILLSTEGINLFVAGSRQAIDELLTSLRSEPEFADLQAKESMSEEQPFGRMLVRIKNEIIAFGVESIDPRRKTSPRISARKLKEWLDSDQPVTLLDVRNDYEVELGTFENARAIGVDHFRDFPTAVRELPEELRDAPVVTFCTGGIRCEKAGPFLEQAGFRNVYQLDGGILKYFEECGGDHYAGECFVFDKRVALDPELNETETEQCFACRSALTTSEQLSEQYVPGVSCPHCFESEESVRQTAIRRREQAIQAVVRPLPGSVPYENRRPMNVPGRFDGASAIEFLDGLQTRLSADEWRREFAESHVLRRETPIRPDITVRAGDQLIHCQPNTVEPPVSDRITVLFEDECLLVINKPAPLAMHPCGRFHRNTLTWILDQACAPLRVRPLHRLDANTSGVVVLARSRRIAGLIQPQFARGEVRKHYIAQVAGHPAKDEFEVTSGITSSPGLLGHRQTTAEGLAAQTRLTVLQRHTDGTSTLAAVPVTGRTNQIRIHLADAGFPICGDPVYGTAPLPEHATLSPTDPPMRLHAASIELLHPDGHPLKFEAPPPDWYAV